MGSGSVLGNNTFATTSSDVNNATIYNNAVNLQASTRQDILNASLGDEQRQQLLTQIDAIKTDNTSDRMNLLKPIIDTLSAKKSLSDQVAKLYQSAVAQASKNQSTVITNGQPAAVAPQGNSSIITGPVGATK